MNEQIEPSHLSDCKVLSGVELRNKYRREANTHRNMLHRQKTASRSVHPDFKVFRSFLAVVGPCPSTQATLDRIDNDDPEYAPGKVQWADKRTQNSNKSDTLILRSRTNEIFTTSQLARRQRVSSSAIRKRLQRGWTDDEIINGHSQRAPDTVPPMPRKPVRSVSERSSTRPDRTRPLRDELWERNAYYAVYCREKEGAEYCLADLETINECISDCCPPIPQVIYERHFEKWWAAWKPHLIRKNLPEWAQELIAKLEGTTLAEIRAREVALADQL